MKIPSYDTAVLKSEAARLGFSACGVAVADHVGEKVSAAFNNWLACGFNADMRYMEGNQEKRMDPRLLLPGAKSVVVVAMNYYPSKFIKEEQPQFAYYAYGKDYHDVMKSRLEHLASVLGVVDVRYVKEKEDFSGKHLGLICCDTVPMLDRYWAWRAGLGFIGKNTSLIIPGKGSYFFLGEIITDLSFTSYDQPLESHCGRCEQCLHACPTGALGESYRIDASKCLSYLTIENRGAIPDEYAGKMGDCIYGCDRCQQACPHNRFAAPTSIEELEPSEELLSMTADDWKQLTKDGYQRLFRGSAVKRAKFDGLKRNIDAALNGIDES